MMVRCKVLIHQWIDIPRSPPLGIPVYVMLAVLRVSRMSKFTHFVPGLILGDLAASTSLWPSMG